MRRLSVTPHLLAITWLDMWNLILIKLDVGACAHMNVLTATDGLYMKDSFL